jgi:hypothetical protein
MSSCQKRRVSGLVGVWYKRDIVCEILFFLLEVYRRRYTAWTKKSSMGLFLHPGLGTLGTLDAAYKMPVSGETTDPSSVEPIHIDMLWPVGLTQSKEYSFLIAWSLQNFYTETTVQPNASKLVGGLISYLNCLLPPQYFNGSRILDGAFLNHGISAHWRVVTKDNLHEYLTPEIFKIFRMFRPEAQQRFIHERCHHVGLIGVLFLLIGQSVTSARYDGWILNRLRTFR